VLAPVVVGAAIGANAACYTRGQSPMKPVFLACFLSVCCLLAQPPALPNLPDETVVATFDDGVAMTYGEFKRIVSVLPQANQTEALNNRAEFLHQWALMRKMAKAAEAEKLDQLSPAKEALEYYRLVVLSQAKMDKEARQTVVLPSEVEKFYQDNQDRYRQTRVKAIYVGFGGQKVTEAAAKAKASLIVAEARKGVDFVKLVQSYSDDAASKAKDGDFLTLRDTDQLPPDVRAAIFRLKEGEISDPVRQSNGFYIFKAEKVDVRPLLEVRGDIFTELKTKKYTEWMQQSSRDASVFFNGQFIGAVPMDTTPRRK
jgi:peptidyl-prolyl cis-trans isomerase C